MEELYADGYYYYYDDNLTLGFDNKTPTAFAATVEDEESIYTFDFVVEGILLTSVSVNVILITPRVSRRSRS